eukprot:Skav205386  [mRNA]  locus=scaffold1642:16677:23573:+ [translate_table: standard]
MAQENSAHPKAAGSSDSAPQEPKSMALRKAKDEAKEGKDSARGPHSSRPARPRRTSAPGPTPRSTSEPPHTAQSQSLSDGAVARTPRSLGDPRLPKLLTDIESHFRRVERKLPLDASGWLRETAQLELFEEAPDVSASDASPSAAPKFVDGGNSCCRFLGTVAAG